MNDLTNQRSGIVIGFAIGVFLSLFAFALSFFIAPQFSQNGQGEGVMGANSNIYADDAKSVTTSNFGDETALNVSSISTYSSTTPSYSDGDIVSTQFDANGNIKVDMTKRLDPINDGVRAYPDDYSYDYEASASANVVIKSTAGYLHAIIVGKDVSGGIIEVSDHASDGDGNVKVYLEDPDVGTYIVDASFSTGIASDITTQTNVTFIYR